MLRSHSELTPEEIYRAYRQLAQVERVFRTVKGPLRLRPVRHFVDRLIRGYVNVCFLAYALEMALGQSMGRAEGLLSGDLLDEHAFAQTMRDLKRVTVATVATSIGTYEIRSPLEGKACKAYRAVGLWPPPQLISGLSRPVVKWLSRNCDDSIENSTGPRDRVELSLPGAPAGGEFRRISVRTSAA